MSEILDKDESHIHLDDKECCKSLCESHICREEPKCHDSMCHDESHKNLEYEHDGYFLSFWHILRFWHREVPDPYFSNRCDRIVPEPTEEKKYESSTAKSSSMCEWRQHERDEIHSIKENK